jgi:hypothetical protein
LCPQELSQELSHPQLSDAAHSVWQTGSSQLLSQDDPQEFPQDDPQELLPPQEFQPFDPHEERPPL